MTRGRGAARFGRLRGAVSSILWASLLAGGAGPAAPIPAEVATLEGKALAAERSKKPLDALALRAEAIRAAERASRPRLVAVLLARSGALLEAQDRVQDAVVAYESGLRALEGAAGLDVSFLMRKLREATKGFDSPEYAPAPVDLYAAVFDPDLERAERDPAIVVRLLVGVGNAYARQPQDGPALGAYERALARPEVDLAPELGARIRANAGEIRRRQGDLDRAEADLNAARAWMEAHAPPAERRRVLALLAGIARDRGRLEEAEAGYDAAIALHAGADDPAGEARARAGRGRVRLLRREWAAARADFEAAVAHGRRANDGELLWHAYFGLGSVMRQLGDLEGAAKALEEALGRVEAWRGGLATDEGKVTFVDGARGVTDELVDVHLARAARGARGAWRDALDVVEKARARALEDLMAGAPRRARDAGTPVVPVRCFGSSGPGPGRSMELARGVPSDDPRRQMASGTPSDRTEQTARNVPSPPRSGSSTGPAPARARGVPSLARLVFHVGEAQTVVLAVAQDGGIAGAAIPIGARALEARVRALLGALGVDGPVRGGVAIHGPGASGGSPPGPVEPLLEAMYRDLVVPVARGLPRPGATLVLEPHGPLWLVPFAALRTGGGEPLVDRWPIVYAPSSAVLDELRATPEGGPPASAPALLVGDPLTAAIPVVERDASYEFQPLPGTRREVAEIARLFTGQPPDVRVGPRAALDGVVEDVHRFRVVHLATHGVALGRDPLGSFLVLGDSRCGRYLTARDVTQLGLAADLVALSACQTGLGQLSGDGVIGLARSFLVAGARTVLVSLWNVSDVRTAELMAEFYREWLSRGADKASALRRAMLAVRKGHPDPRLWAPFLLVGAER